MNIVFIGRDNSFNRRIIKELQTEHKVLCSFFVEPERFSNRGILEKTKNRLKKYPFYKIIDELIFHYVDRKFLRNNEKVLHKTKPDYFIENHTLQLPNYTVNNIHDVNHLELITQLKPDIIFSVCCSVLFKPDLYNIPALGTFVLHDGITPEYKGLHNNLWAIMKKDYKNIGYTVLKAGNAIDGGDILVQGKYELKKDENYRTWGWINHNAIILGMPQIMLSLRMLEENKKFIPYNTFGRKSSYYTWIGITDFIRLYIQNYFYPLIRNKFAPLSTLVRYFF